MHRTRQHIATENTILVDTVALAQILSCGRDTAIKIGTAAGARIKVGKRVLWHLATVQDYVAEEAQRHGR